MEWLVDILKEPIVESFGGAGAALALYRLILVLLSVYGKREDTEQAEAEASQADSAAMIAKEESTQQLIGVIGSVATTNQELTHGLGKMSEAITLSMTQSQRTESVVITQGAQIDGLQKTIGEAATAMTEHTGKVDEVGKGIIDTLAAQTTAEQYEQIIKLLRELKQDVSSVNEVTSGLVERVETVETTVHTWADRVKRESQEMPAAEWPEGKPLMPNSTSSDAGLVDLPPVITLMESSKPEDEEKSDV